MKFQCFRYDFRKYFKTYTLLLYINNSILIYLLLIYLLAKYKILNNWTSLFCVACSRRLEKLECFWWDSNLDPWDPENYIAKPYLAQVARLCMFMCICVFASLSRHVHTLSIFISYTRFYHSHQESVDCVWLSSCIVIWVLRACMCSLLAEP